MAVRDVWTFQPPVQDPQVLVHDAAFAATQELFELDIVPEAKRESPVSPTNPKIVGTKYKDTGHNRRSIDCLVEDGENGPEATLFTQSGYGAYLELGTSKMPARPYLYPSFAKFIGTLKDRVAEKLKAL